MGTETRNLVSAERARELSTGVSKNGSVAYYDLILEAISKGLTHVFLDFKLAEKSIQKLKDAGYTVDTLHDEHIVDLSKPRHMISW